MRYTMRDLLRHKKKALLHAKVTEASEAVKAIGMYLRRGRYIPKAFIDLTDFFKSYLPGLTRGEMRRIYIDHQLDLFLAYLERKGEIKVFKEKDGRITIQWKPKEDKTVDMDRLVQRFLDGGEKGK